MVRSEDVTMSPRILLAWVRDATLGELALRCLGEHAEDMEQVGRWARAAGLDPAEVGAAIGVVQGRAVPREMTVRTMEACGRIAGAAPTAAVPVLVRVHARAAREGICRGTRGDWARGAVELGPDRTREAWRKEIDRAVRAAAVEASLGPLGGGPSELATDALLALDGVEPMRARLALAPPPSGRLSRAVIERRLARYAGAR